MNGPLAMYPAADDNYGLDACSLLCLHSHPPIIAMGTGSGKIYHCIVLDSEEAFDPEEVGLTLQIIGHFLIGFYTKTASNRV